MNNSGSLFFQLSTTSGLMQKATGGPVSYRTREYYLRKLHYAADFYAERGVRSITEIGLPQIQAYADHLVRKGKSAATIHGYLAPLCKALQVPMDQIQKPLRITSEYTRSRMHRDRYEDVPLQNLPSSILMSKCTGLRRSELRRLKGRDLVVKDGFTYVIAEKGKGGKRQMQRILPKYVPYVEALFRDVPPDQKVLEDFVENYDYHQVRRKLARECYYYYEEQCAKGEVERKKLYRQIASHWHRFNKRNRNKLERYSYFNKPYFLRGKTKAVALSQDKPIILDRLCLRAVSIFHLAHWRDNVTTQSYY